MTVCVSYVGVSGALSDVPAVVTVPVSNAVRVVMICTEEVAPLDIPETVTGRIDPLGVPSVSVPDPAVTVPDHAVTES